jgi:DNA-binding LacI/PurR family transcriptional regulator
VSPFAPLLVRGIQDCLVGQNYSCQIVNSDWNPEIERTAIQNLLDRPVDGIIFVEYSHRTADARLDQSGKPYVFVHRLFSSSIRNSIVPDDYLGARRAVAHLLRLGHKTIGYIDGPSGWHSARRRREGYCDELAANGLPVVPALMQPGDWEVEGGQAGALRLLRAHPLPTAIFAANDLMAIGAIYALQHMGLNVPGDVAVVGYDNREVARLLRPRLTTVAMPVYEMGFRAATLLLQQIDGGLQDFDEIRIPGTLYVRESCGAPPDLQTKEEKLSITDVRRRLINRNPDIE